MAGPDLSLISSMASQLSSLTVPLLSVFAALIVVLVASKAIKLLILAVRGNKIEYGGRTWDRDVWETAMRDVKQAQASGARIDRETKRAIKNDGKLF